ncbi:Flp pilus assembly protein RcpC/CpaB [hydrothermal vent metagenome]|uniref:Flp pilus assembly protein RcpC/CpaB n=1 Tax=hydrothermal vent metagenome TaxID=652676 RepID=A0A3B1D459_9ZZZZ
MKSLTPAKLSLIMFLGVGLLVAGYFAKRMFATAEEPPKVENRTVPMALSDIEPGTTITAAHIGVGYIDPAEIKSDMLLSSRVIIGRVAKEKISALKPIRSSNLYSPGYRIPLDVEEGMRAVSINLDDSADMVGGHISIGEYVDVHMTVDAATANTNMRALAGGLTLTLFKGVKVLSINNNSSDLTSLNRVGNAVTLELTPAQANIIILSKERGKITLSYNPEGKGTGVVGVSDENRATLHEILGLKAPEQPTAPFITEHYNGTGRRAIMFRRVGNRIIRYGASYNGNNGTNGDSGGNGMNFDDMNQNSSQQNTFNQNRSRGSRQNRQGRRTPRNGQPTA